MRRSLILPAALAAGALLLSGCTAESDAGGDSASHGVIVPSASRETSDSSTCVASSACG